MSTIVTDGHTDERKHLLYWLDILINGLNPKLVVINALHKLVESHQKEKGREDDSIEESDNEDTELEEEHSASQCENVNQYIKEGFHKCHKSTKFSYLHRLVIHKYTNEILNIIEESNEDFSRIRDNVGITLLHLAAENSLLDVVSKLIAIGVDIDLKTNKGATPLHFAVRKNDVACVKLLLKHNGNATMTDNFKYTPIDYAKAVEGMECLKILEKHIHENKLKHHGIYRALSVEETQTHREKTQEKWNSIVIQKQKRFDG